MKVESNKLENGDLEIKLTFDAHDQLCLEHDLLDIVDWYAKGPSQEKIRNCEKRMLKECQHLVMNDPDVQSLSVRQMNTMLNDPLKMVQAIANHPNYQNRNEREQNFANNT